MTSVHCIKARLFTGDFCCDFCGIKSYKVSLYHSWLRQKSPKNRHKLRMLKCQTREKQAQASTEYVRYDKIESSSLLKKFSEGIINTIFLSQEAFLIIYKLWSPVMIIVWFPPFCFFIHKVYHPFSLLDGIFFRDIHRKTTWLITSLFHLLWMKTRL